MKLLSVVLITLLCLGKAYAQNYAESKVPVYILPGVLKTVSGKMIRDKASWENIRRPEILRLFEDNVYGQMPKDFESIKFELTNNKAIAMNGKAHLKEVTITISRLGKIVAIHLTLFVPNNRKGPSPAFLLINNRPPGNTQASRETKSEFWPAEMLIDSGYAIAAFHVADAAPDKKEEYMNGALQLYPEQLTKDNGMKAVGAWAWAASRVMDYFKTDKDIDFKKVAVVGHSRGGKAALWAGAQDKRFAMVIANCSGNTGAALSRRKFGETVKVINTNFPHWFATSYKKYNDNEGALPVDQHMLISLIAPRPIYTTNATKDLWADPKGSYLSLINALPVYQLYGQHTTLPDPDEPSVNIAITNALIGYHNREGIHDMTAFDWANFIRFANFHYRHK